MSQLKSAAFVATLVGLVFVVSVPAVAQDPTTLWSFMGIPQGLHKIHDAVINHKGNHPALERKPPLVRIADPANLEAEMPPAIQAAAKIKIDQDMEAQKIKAIKFLGTVGCGCYQDAVDVRAALVDALADCTEDVRLEAARALAEVAGAPCQQCESSCCNAETMQALHKMAYGQDEKGCNYESSARVRAAAANALNACRQRFPTTPTTAPLETEPTEAAPAPVESPKEAIFMPTPLPLKEVGFNSSDSEQTVRLASDIQEISIRQPSSTQTKFARSIRQPSSTQTKFAGSIRQPSSTQSKFVGSIRQPMSTQAEFGGKQRYNAMPATMLRAIESPRDLGPLLKAE